MTLKRTLEANNKKTDQRLRKTYGISLKDYNRMLKAQNFGCWICGRKAKKRRLHIDHDHATRKVRGLLCMAHNYALGRRGFNDNIEHLRLAVLYLEKEIPNQLTEKK